MWIATIATTAKTTKNQHYWNCTRIMYTYLWSQFAITVVKLRTYRRERKSQNSHCTNIHHIASHRKITSIWIWLPWQFVWVWVYMWLPYDCVASRRLCDTNECNLNLNMFYFSLFSAKWTRGGQRWWLRHFRIYCTFITIHTFYTS